MAGSSPGSEWSPLLLKGSLSRKAENETQTNLLEVTKCIVKNENSFLTNTEDDFHSALSVVLADFLIRSASQRNLTLSGIIVKTCKIIMPNLLGSLKRASDHYTSGSPSLGEVHPNHILLSLKALCSGVVELNDTDFEQLENYLKDSEVLKDSGTPLPEGLKKNRPDLNSALLEQFVSLIPGTMFEKSLSTQLRSEIELSGSPRKENYTQNMSMVCSQSIANLCRLDASDTIINFCMSLPHLSVFTDKWISTSDGSGLNLPWSLSEAQVLKLGIIHLRDDILMAKKALSLPLLEPCLTSERLRSLTTIAMGCLTAGLSVATAHSLLTVAFPAPTKSSGNNSSTCGSNIATTKAIACPGSSVTNTSRDESEWESCAITVVEAAVEIYQTLSELIRSSPRSGRTCYDNFLYLAAWLILSGLQVQMICISQAGVADKGSKDDKGKSPSKHKDSVRINLTKVQQGFGGLSVVLASQALGTLEKLLEPSSSDADDQAEASSTLPPAGFNVMEDYTHAQRMSRLLTDLPLTQMLFHIATVSYRKSCNLKRIQKSGVGGDGETVSLSDSATYYDDDDDFSCSEESSAPVAAGTVAPVDDDDDDSEPILGHWFEETITPPEPKDGSKTGKNSAGHGDSECGRGLAKAGHRNTDISLSVPDKGEPHGFIVLAAQVFAFMNDRLLWTTRLRSYTSASLSEHQLALLAAIIRDLDRETARTETGTIATCFGLSLGHLFSRFSHALSRYVHNLLAGQLLSPSLQVALLDYLNVNPWSEQDGDEWPLMVHPRSLTVLAQVILAKQRRENGGSTGGGKESSEAACLAVWKRLLDTMIRHIENPNGGGASDKEKEADDLNVEHAQLLLFLFHSLPLMQKKAVLLLCAQTLVRAAQAAFSIVPLQDGQLMLLARILLMLEYLVKNLYDAPATMLEQIQWNLLGSQTSDSSFGQSAQPSVTRMYHCCRELEDSYRKFGLDELDGSSVRPRFYLLNGQDGPASGGNNQELPKLDGLACSFLLAPSDTFKYSAFYSAVLNVLHVLHQCEFHSVRKDKRDYSALCAVQYCFSAGWRLIQCLPPSNAVMESLSNSSSTGSPSSGATSDIVLEPSALLHALLWGPRSAHKVYNAWITDCLVKQGLTTQRAIFVVKAAAKNANSTTFLVRIAKQLGHGMRQSSRLKDMAAVPDLWDVLVMDMVIARLRLLYDECSNKDNGDESYRVLDSPTEKLPKTCKIAKEMFMDLCDLVDSVANLSRRCVLHDALGNSTDTPPTPTAEGSSEAEALQHLLAISSTRGCKLANITPALSHCLPPFLRAALERWNGSGSLFPSFSSGRLSGSGPSADLIPSESYLNGILNAHLQLLSSQQTFSPASSLRHLLDAAVRLANDLVVWYPNAEEAEKELVGVFFPIALDACFENLVDLVQLVMERLVGSADSDRYQDIASYIVVSHCHSLVTSCGGPIVRCLDERALEECIRFLESCVDGPLTRHPLSRFYTFEDEVHSLWDIIFSTTAPELSTSYMKSVYRFVNKLLIQSAENNDTDLDNLCLTLLNLERVDEDRLEAWIELAVLRHLMDGPDDKDALKPQQQAVSTPVVARLADAEMDGDIEDSKNSGPTATPTAPNSLEVKSVDGISLLQNLTEFAMRRGPAEDFARTLLRMLLKQLSPSGRACVTPDLVVIMVKLASVGQGSGQKDLFLATLDWLVKYQQMVATESWTSLSHEDLTSPPPELASFCCLLQYATDVLQALKSLGSNSSSATAANSVSGCDTTLLPPPPPMLELSTECGGASAAMAVAAAVEVEDWAEELGLDDVESDGDESDEDMLCNKLCTYVITQKEFMNQHWYHCHTCRMVDGVGVCSVCAKVCHRDHDVTYAKFGSFFCDCGAKEDGSCQALVRRPPQQSTYESEISSSSNQYQQHRNTSSSSYGPYRADSAPSWEGPDGTGRAGSSEEITELSENGDKKRRLLSLSQQLEPFADELLHVLSTSELAAAVVDVLDALLPAIERASRRLSPVGSLQRARRTLERLHYHQPKTVTADESLMIPTLGSQEGAFENVRMSFTGDQGQTIRQLLSAHVLRRVSMCCLSSLYGRRQHLAMSHEKGKVTVLQLSSLLKQADASKRKLTLTRLSSAPVPFTVLSMAANPANEDVLAVCGLKEVHVMTLAPSGSVHEHLALHPQLETGNFVIKAVWLPGQPTQLAVITADFVKIYDLSIDVLSPQYFFLLPSGKVRDCSFWFRPDGGAQFTFFISSSGYIYWQPLNAESSARHGPFYVTNILDVSHPEIKDGANGQTGGGGVSVYFSHSMQLLCFSYAQGKTFVASVGEDSRSELQLGPLHSIYIPTKSGSISSIGSLKLTTSGSSTPVMGPQQPLCQWAEVPGHPGLLLTLTQSSYTPVIIMIEPERILVEEIKVVPAKVKVTDMVAIRHVVNSGDSRDKTEQRTTLILLCDDGSLRIFMASPDATSYWLSPTLQPASLTSSLSSLQAPKLARRQESLATGLPGSNRQPERSSGVSVTNGSPTFPTDFFESCTAMNDLEFGGADLLHVYNAAQLKHRLNTNGLYVACTKQTGFCMEITNTDPASTVMVGVRILVGSQDIQKAPSFVELFGRNVPLVTQRHRWFDIPLTKEESLQADKKLVLMFGSSNDPLGVTMIDSIKVYGKTKENFGWPDDAEDQLLLDGGNAASDGQQNHIPVTAENSQKHSSKKLVVQSAAQVTLDRLVGGAVALLEGSVSLARPAVRLQQVLDLSTHILTLSWSGASCVPNCVKDLLASLHPSREAYHDYKDRVLLLAVLDDLKAIQDKTSPIYLDPEAFYNVLAVTRSIAATHSLNLIKFTKKPVEGEEPDTIDFVDELLSVGWRLHRERARNPLLSPVGQLGLSQIDFFVQATVDVLFAFALAEDESEQNRRMTQILDHYLALLLCDDAGVSHAAKAALQRTIKNKNAKETIAKVLPLASTDEDDIMRLAIAMSLESGPSQATTTEVAPLSRTTTTTTNPKPLRNLRLALLQRVTAELPELKRNGGLKSIHFLQVLLMLVSELRPSDPEERTELQRALVSAVAQLDLEGRQAAQEVAGQRTPQHEVQLLVMKFFGFLLSTHKSRDRRLSRSRHSASSTSSSTMSPSLAMVAARVLLDAGLMERCLVLLQAILIHWKATGSEDEVAVVAGLLKYPPVASTAYDLSPFFPRTAGSKSNCSSGSAGVSQIFDGFSQLLTEMALRLPYLVKKVMPSVELDERWVECLCQYVSAPTPSAVKRHVRKLLLFHCGSKEKYRQVRDLLTLETHFDDVRKLALEYGLDTSLRNSTNSHQDGLLLVLPYDELVNVMEHLKVCLDVASTRTTNWQLFCKKHVDTLPFLVKLACFIDEGVCCTLLQLLRYALCPLKSASNSTVGSVVMNNQADVSTVASTSSSASEPWDLNCSCTGADGCICGGFAQSLHAALERRLLSRFVFRFLLDCHVSAVRWHAHAILHSIFRHSNVQQQQDLVALMWSLWSGLQLYGRKAAQFVDLLGYLTITTPGLENSLPGYVDRAVTLLREENQLIVRHPNAVLYGALSGLVHLDGYYLERDPCLACSSPEIPFASVKLTALKADVRFTTSTQIVKLTSSHVVNRLALRISDIKRTKMVRTVNIYYNNRPVQAAVELKNRPGVWLKAKKLSLTPGQAEIKVDLPLPITCCNLKMEFAAFYENLNASSEMLQCPRCSASVPAHPGVCSNCGENVYQCHKCRSINYDEKDPFLCNACGFCKYAKFELTLSARPCCTVEPVENEDDRKKSLQNINTFLEKADRLQTQLVYSREALEVLVSKLGESAISGDVAGMLTAEEASATTPPGNVGTPAGSASTPAVASSSTGIGPTGHINRTIQHIAQRYHTECRTTFEELSKIAQRVAACRRDIVAYDAGQRQKAVKRSGGAVQAASVTGAVEGDAESAQFLPLPAGATCCYGCACGALDHCLTLLRAMATKPFLRRLMFERGLLHELLNFNVAQGSSESRGEVRDLLCLLTLNNADAVDCLNHKLMDSVDGVLLRRSGHSLALLNSVRHEMALLAASLQCQDTCWERRLRSVVQLFLKSTKHLDSPAVMDVITLPCLRVIQELIQNTTTSSNIPEPKPGGQVQVLMDLKRWLQGDSQHSFDAWKSRVPSRYDMPVAGKAAEQVRHLHLAQKYAARWRDRCHQIRQQQQPISCQLSGANWLRAMLFNPNSRLSRQTACVFLEGLARVPQRRQEIVNLLTSLLCQLGTAGPYGAEFFSLYMSLVRKDHWRYYLVVSRRLLPQLAGWIEIEIEGVTRQEAAGRSSELCQGHAMRWLVEMLAYFLEEPSIRQAFKGRLVAHVLNGYLGLRKLVLQRTRLIEETQELLLQLLGDMTTGTEAETRQFMSVCVNTLQKCHGEDLVTPVFVVERLCSIIHPEEKDDVEFLMSLDKDPQQEDFLQGRMQGNPYSSAEPGLGPLMRDIKNKICQDCELIALLEDDTGMELLVCNKIMSLDLPVRDVYRKVFLTESNEAEPMRVVYRMRGLLGDATEEFIERLDDKHQRPANDEETYRLASVMGECGGLGVLLERLSCVRDIEGEGRPLLGALVKLLSFCTKVQTNRALLVTPELNAVQRLLVALKLCLQAQQNMPPPFTEQLLEVMEAILCQASGQSVEDYARFSSTFGTKEDLDFLLQLSAQMAGSKTTTNILTRLTRVIPFLTFVNDVKMDVMIEHFRQSLEFSQYDTEHSSEQAIKLELFCALTSGIEHNAIGNTLKDRLVASKVVENALDYLRENAPPIRTAVARDSAEWKDFVAKPSLKFVLRLLTGLAHSHVTTQLALSVDAIPLFHHLEQISSDEHVGSLAENLLEAMRGHPEVAERIEEVRQQTKREKKRLAMAMRENQLRALGMKTNALGQVKAENPILQQLVDMGLGEEPGPVCVICREGYRFQPGRVLAIYTFSRRCQLEDLETQLWYGTAAASSSASSSSGSSRGRKTLGYYTVSHFNVVHVECHLSAVRLARARDEWESAALQNANTRCNGLLPLWGPQVPESAFASCLARHNTYLQECTGHRDIGYVSTCHDLKLLLLRFSLERSFSDESGGGGPQSNMHFLPYLMHAALYVLNTTRSWSREEKNLKAFLETPRGEKWVENGIEAENAFYFSTLALLVMSNTRWNATRITFLGRLLVTAHCRAQPPSKGTSATGQRHEKQVLDYSVYKPALVFFAIINAVFNVVLKNVSVGDIDSDWPGTVAEYIRHNDEIVLRAINDKVLGAYQNDYLTSGSFEEFCDVVGLLEDIPSPEDFIRDLLQSIP